MCDSDKMSVHCSMLTEFGCRFGRTSRVQDGEEFHERWSLPWNAPQQQRQQRYLGKAFIFQTSGAYRFLCTSNLISRHQRWLPTGGVLCELYQDWELHTHQLKAVSIKVLKHLAKASFHRDTFSSGMNFDKSPSYMIWRLRPLVHCVNWVFAQRYQHKPSEMLNQYNIVEVISEQWLTSLSVHWNGSDFLRAICSAGKNLTGEGVQRIIYPRPP